MNTDNLIRAIAQARIEFMRNNPKEPTTLYLDNVHAMKLEWHMKEHCDYSGLGNSKTIFNGMRVFPVMVADEHLQIC